MIAFFHRLQALFCSTSTSSPGAIRSSLHASTMRSTRSFPIVPEAPSMPWTRWQSVEGHGCGAPSSRRRTTNRISSCCSGPLAFCSASSIAAAILSSRSVLGSVSVDDSISEILRVLDGPIDAFVAKSGLLPLLCIPVRRLPPSRSISFSITSFASAELILPLRSVSHCLKTSGTCSGGSCGSNSVANAKKPARSMPSAPTAEWILLSIASFRCAGPKEGVSSPVPGLPQDEANARLRGDKRSSTSSRRIDWRSSWMAAPCWLDRAETKAAFHIRVDRLSTTCSSPSPSRATSSHSLSSASTANASFCSESATSVAERKLEASLKKAGSRAA
mmetsp:Transcript_18402/g.51221  ORF Transcript_18402/g.51221 Transcript_18402/m.51221 type:complete len:332 (+) Transcript_18402:4114-5109(+)